MIPNFGVVRSKSESCSTDSELLSDYGKKFVITDKLLGSGSFGSVYLATDENGREIAVKCCDLDSTGIPNILESTIMTSFVHPCLNSAIRVHSTKEKLYILQELAKEDLSQKTRKDKGKHKPSLQELRKWCFQIAQGLFVLHSEGIIHADIKANNVLLYEDGNVKLTDFTLATRKSSPGEKFTHNVCTSTHRSLECLTGKSWDESLDIWSLGCTFYEIAYGETLFPYQGALEPEGKKDREAKSRLKKRCVNAILDWSVRKPGPKTEVNCPQYPLDFLKFKLTEDFKSPELKTFNKLVLWMLTVLPEKRPSILEVLKHPFFKDMKPSVYLSVKRPTNKIDLAEHSRVSHSISSLTDNLKVQEVALSIYCKCNNLKSISEYKRAFTCTWLASKLVLGDCLKNLDKMTLDEVIQTEITICHNLLFRLH